MDSVEIQTHEALSDQREERWYNLQECAKRYEEKQVVVLISNLKGV